MIQIMNSKKIMLLAVFCSAVALSSVEASQNHNSNSHSSTYITPPGFVGPDAGGEMSVKDLLATAQDNVKMCLKGYIIKRISHDKYVFTDGTGEVVVEIDNKNMPQEQITPKTLIKLYGKVDKDYFPSKIEVDVKSVEIQK
jgi:uncharacterized protein (TIGR00156 family)